MHCRKYFPARAAWECCAHASLPAVFHPVCGGLFGRSRSRERRHKSSDHKHKKHRTRSRSRERRCGSAWGCFACVVCVSAGEPGFALFSNCMRHLRVAV